MQLHTEYKVVTPSATLRNVSPICSEVIAEMVGIWFFNHFGTSG